ncbi:MAG: YHS domain-containing (seleno)protein [Phycisphaerales bacterium]
MPGSALRVDPFAAERGMNSGKRLAAGVVIMVVCAGALARTAEMADGTSAPPKPQSVGTSGQPKPEAEGTPAPPKPEAPARDVKQYNLGKGGLAAQGYDVVAYFGPKGDGKGGEAKKGSEQFALTHGGVKYLFSSQANLELFKSAPGRFEPAYGGWCAFAMANDDKVEIDPKSFLVSDARLYLFYKGLFNDTRAKWVKKEMELNPKADKAWKKISGEEPPSEEAKKCPLCK